MAASAVMQEGSEAEKAWGASALAAGPPLCQPTAQKAEVGASETWELFRDRELRCLWKNRKNVSWLPH